MFKALFNFLSFLIPATEYRYSYAAADVSDSTTIIYPLRMKIYQIETPSKHRAIKFQKTSCGERLQLLNFYSTL